jgi:hypothetical protein
MLLQDSAAAMIMLGYIAFRVVEQHRNPRCTLSAVVIAQNWEPAAIELMQYSAAAICNLKVNAHCSFRSVNCVYLDTVSSPADKIQWGEALTEWLKE